MANIPFIKIMTTMAPCLLKETILSKLSNFIHTFSVDVTRTPFGDTHKKYINTIMKLNNSKTLMLETRGEEVMIQNTTALTFKEGQKIDIEFSKLKEHETDTIFVNYQYLDDVPVEAHIGFDKSNISLEVVESEDGILSCVVRKSGTINPNAQIIFEKYKPKLSFLSEIDKKNVVRGLQSGINLIAASSVKKPDDITSIKEFLMESQGGEGVKVVARLHTKEAFASIIDICKVADGIIYSPGTVQKVVNNGLTDKDIFEEVKKYGKQFICCLDKISYIKNPVAFQEFLQLYADLGVDSFMIAEDVVDDPELLQDEIIKIHEHIQQIVVNTHYLDREVEFGRWAVEAEHVQNYIIHRAFKTAQELPIKAIICYTETGSAIAKLGGLRNIIPLVVFTKSDPVYRYINNLRGVKGYKISQSFDYGSFKRIGKEMIRILFKGSISLEDKILIMQIREEGVHEQEGTSDMVNGIELYKFKNM